jgi:hypothetical protein
LDLLTFDVIFLIFILFEPITYTITLYVFFNTPYIKNLIYSYIDKLKVIALVDNPGTRTITELGSKVVMPIVLATFVASVHGVAETVSDYHAYKYTHQA